MVGASNRAEWTDDIQPFPNLWHSFEDQYPLNQNDSDALEQMHQRLIDASNHYVGFPNSRIFSYSTLAKFLKFNINNIGDPYHPNSGMNTCDQEVELINFFSKMFKLCESEAWGSATNGSSESTLFAMLAARERFPDAHVLFSDQAHYCMPKNAYILNLPFSSIASDQYGRMCMNALEADIKKSTDRSIIIVATIGTTFMGAIDPVADMIRLCEKYNVNYYMHLDAALLGPMLPFMKDGPTIDFTLPIDSLSFSAHKFLGMPIPYSFVLTRSKLKYQPCSAEYVGSIDTTISSSKDGFTTLLVWEAVKRLGLQGFKELTEYTFALTHQIEKRLVDANISFKRQPHSNVIAFKKPSPSLCRKWQLSTKGDLAHMIPLPGVTMGMVNAFIDELKIDALKIDELKIDVGSVGSCV